MRFVDYLPCFCINFFVSIFAGLATYHLSSLYTGFRKIRAERVWNRIITTQQETDVAPAVSHCCSKCGRVYTRKGNLQRHLSWECGKEPHQKCPYCPYATNRKESIQGHIFRRHKNMPNIS